MSKLRLVIGVLVLLLLGSGCANKSSNSTSNTRTAKPVEKTIDYLKLKDSEKDEMSFSFIRNTDQNKTAIDLKIVNRTSKNINFNQSKVLLVHQGGDTITSTKDGTRVIKSNSRMTIKGLFNNIDPSEFQTVGLFCYQSSKNKLAYSEVGQDLSKSSNLTNSKLSSAYQASMTTEEPKRTKRSANNEDDNNQANQTNDDNQSQQNSTDTQGEERNRTPDRVTNSDQAIALVENVNGPAPENTAYSIMTDGLSNSGQMKNAAGQMIYWVRLSATDATAGGDIDDWTVYPDGKVDHIAPTM